MRFALIYIIDRCNHNNNYANFPANCVFIAAGDEDVR